MKRHIVSAADDSYVQHYAVMLASFIDCNDRHAYTFHLLTTGLSSVSQEKLASFVQSEGIDLRIIDVTSHLPRLESLPVWGHITAAAYYRLLIASALPAEVQAAIYLDCDLVVLKDLSALFAIDMSRHAVAAVSDHMREDYWRDLRLSRGEDYFNSGVLLINVNYWRSHDVTAQAMTYVRLHPQNIRYHDQCALNAVLAGRVRYLGEEWNMKWTRVEEAAAALDNRRVSESFPAILHFAGPIKPWAYVCERAGKALYWKYLRCTPWRDFVPPDRTFLNRLKRVVPSPARHALRAAAERFR